MVRGISEQISGERRKRKDGCDDKKTEKDGNEA